MSALHERERVNTKSGIEVIAWEQAPYHMTDSMQVYKKKGGKYFSEFITLYFETNFVLPTWTYSIFERYMEIIY